MSSSAIQIRALASSPTVDLNPHKLEFGRNFAPLWLSCAYDNGAWQTAVIDNLSTISLHPAAITLHYGQSIFEGLKAYKWADGSVNLFRPIENARRFHRSAERMAMPPLDEKFFVESIRALTAQLRDWIPAHPGSLYIRPTMIATEPCIGVRASNQYLYFVIMMPSGAYFPATAGQKGAGAVKVFVTTSVARAAHGGTGNVKAAVNYAVTLKITSNAKAKGCSQVLFLDATGNGRIEEMGGMNVFFVSGKQLLTPPLKDTFLPGITRDSILKLAPTLGYEVEEADLTLDQLRDYAKKGGITEAFACGTAAVITGIKDFLLENGEEFSIGTGAPGAVTSALYDRLTGIQYGKYPDPFGWVIKI
jgi:branched-chain amino acid aminotransferase